MNSPTVNYLFFSLAFRAAMAMIVEGCLIILLKKQLTPLPTRILYGLSALVIGKDRSSRQFMGSISIKDLRSYAFCTLILGAAVLVSSIFYLFTSIL